MTNAETNDNTATVEEQGALVAPRKTASKKAASRKKGAPKSGKTARRGKPSKPAAPGKKATEKQAPRRESASAKILELIGRPKGATLAEIQKATGWQAHYADVRIMPTCVGNPVCGAGIAAMESA